MKKKILIVDDDESIVSLMSFQLHENNYEVFKAKDESECIQIAICEEPDLILIDIMKLHKDGIRAFEQLIQFDIEKNMPIIFMITTFPTAEIKDLVRKMGANGCVTRPFTNIEFEQTIQTVIGDA